MDLCALAETALNETVHLAALMALIVLAALRCLSRADAVRPRSAANGAENTLVISRHDDRVFAGGLMPPAERVIEHGGSEREGRGRGRRRCSRA